MKTKLFSLLAITVLLSVVTGCYSTLDGRMKGGLPFSKDTLESRYERPPEVVFAAAKAVLSYNGTLTEENTISKTVGGQVNRRSVWVKIEALDPKVTKVTVQARRPSGVADIDLASEIDKQIALRLVNP